MGFGGMSNDFEGSSTGWVYLKAGVVALLSLMACKMALCGLASDVFSAKGFIELSSRSKLVLLSLLVRAAVYMPSRLPPRRKISKRSVKEVREGPGRWKGFQDMTEDMLAYEGFACNEVMARSDRERQGAALELLRKGIEGSSSGDRACEVAVVWHHSSYVQPIGDTAV